MLVAITHRLSMFIASEPLLGRLALASLELAGFALLVWLAQRLRLIRSHRLMAALWLLVMMEPPLCLLLSIPGPFRFNIVTVAPPAGRAAITYHIPGKDAHYRSQMQPAEIIDEANSTDEASGPTDVMPAPPLPKMEPPAKRLLPDPSTLLIAFWIGGVTIMAGLTALSYRQLRRGLRRAREASPAMMTCYTAAARSLGLEARRLPRLRVGELFLSPAIVGFLRPVILMPEWLTAEADTEKARWALRHELTHWRLGHPLASGVRGVLQILFFFHPLAWWAGRQWEAAAELSCDRMLLESKPDVAHYTRVLVAMLEAVRCRRGQRMALGMFASRTQIGRRIAALTNNPLRIPNHLTFSRRLLLLLFGAMMLITGGLGLGFKPAVAEASNANAAPAGGKVFDFPPDNASGVLYTRPAGAGEATPWKWLSACEGAVQVPAGMELRLRLIPGREQSASLLDAFAPTDLTALDCAMTEIGDDFLPEIGRLTGLRRLDLEGTKITDKGLAALRSLGALEELSLRTCTGIRGPGLANLAGLGSLKRLQLSMLPKADDDILRHLAGCQRLEVLDMRRLNQDGNQHALLASLPELPRLKEMDLTEHSSLGDADLVHLKRVPNLERLRLCATGVTDQGMQHLAPLKELKMLVLERIKASGAGLASLAALPKLTHLSLRMTSQVNDATLEAIGKITTLRVLDLDLCQVSGKGLAKLGDLKQLETLYLNGSNVGDPIVAQLGSMFPKLRRLACVADGVTDPAQAPLASPHARIKVGVVVSNFTATGPSWINRPYGLGNMQWGGIMAADFGYTTYGIIDPGTAGIKEIKNSLHKLGTSRRTIEGNDVESLKKLDVIVMTMVHNVPDEMLQSITEAVRSGVGLVVVSATGVITPGAENKAVQKLLGITGAQFHWRGNNVPFECAVLKAHPVLAGLAPGDSLTVDTMDGFGGNLTGEALLSAPLGDDSPYSPLYVQQLGKGRCVYYQSSVFARRGLNSSWEEFQYDRSDWIMQTLDRAIEWTAQKGDAQP